MERKSSHRLHTKWRREPEEKVAGVVLLVV